MTAKTPDYEWLVEELKLLRRVPTMQDVDDLKEEMREAEEQVREQSKRIRRLQADLNKSKKMTAHYKDRLWHAQSAMYDVRHMLERSMMVAETVIAQYAGDPTARFRVEDVYGLVHQSLRRMRNWGQ